MPNNGIEWMERKKSFRVTVSHVIIYECQTLKHTNLRAFNKNVSKCLQNTY